MPNFPYYRDIPDAPNDPSQDQPLMKISTNSVDDLLAVDHISFNENDGGYHTIIHQKPEVSDPAAIVGVGQTYVKTVGTDQQLFYESGNGVVQQLTNNSNILPRAAVNFSTGAFPTVTINASFNVTSVVNTFGAFFTINFTNPLTDAFYYVSIVADNSIGFKLIAGTTNSTLSIFFLDTSGTGIRPGQATVTVFQ